MKFQPYFLRIFTPLIISILLIFLGAALQPVSATIRGESENERYVLEKLQKGELADFELDTFPEDKRELRASFLEALLTNRDPRLNIHPHGISIAGAVITGQLDLVKQEIPFDVLLLGCIFKEYVDLTDSHFSKNLNLTRSQFKEMIALNGTSVDLDFVAAGCGFSKGASFGEMHVARGFIIIGSTFDSESVESVSFEGVKVGGAFEAGVCKFESSQVVFADMRVDGNFEAEDCIFTKSTVSFVNAHFHDVFLNGSSFAEVATIDFSRMQADYISLDKLTFETPSEIGLQRMQFKLLSPVNAEKLHFLLSRYDAEFYTNLESSFRTNGYPEEADKIFIAKRRAERRETCKSFLRQCDNRGAFAWSMFQDMLAGYGKRLQNLLYWSLGFLAIGTFVFRREKDMRIKDPKDAPHYAGRYHAFWYSLDLFLPIIKLGEADVWTPKDDRRWANLYRKVHIVIGSLFVPIGLAAWTGIIK